MKLKTLRIMAIITGLIGTTLFNRFMEGGALFMSLILICLLISIYFIVKSILNIKTNIEISKKMLKHISDSGTLGLALGIMGAFLGLITAFDALEASGAAEPSILAGGLIPKAVRQATGIAAAASTCLAFTVLASNAAVSIT